MPPKTEEAQWCDDLRELLKQKATDKSKDKKKAKKELSDKLKILSAQFDKLRVDSPVRHARIATPFKLVASRVDDAVDLDDAGLIVTATEQLAKLMKTLEAERDGHAELIAGLKKFDTDYAKLEIEFAQISGLRGAVTPGSPVKTKLDSASQLTQSADDKRASAEAQAANADLDGAVSLLDQARAKLAEAKAESKNAEQAAKQYLEAMKQWAAQGPAVRAALQEMGSLAGAEAFVGDLQNRFNDAGAQVKNTGGVWVGHPEALKLLGDVAKTLQEARTAHAAHMVKIVPKLVIQAKARTEAELLKLAAVAPDYLVQGYRSEARDLQESGRHDVTAAVAGLDTLTATLKTETDARTKDKQAAQTAMKAFDDAITSLVGLQAPKALYNALERIGDAARNEDMPDRQWAQASERLSLAAKSLAVLLADYTTRGKEWAQKRAELESIGRQASELVVYPAFASTANQVREKAEEALLAFKSGDLTAGIAAHGAAKHGGLPLAKFLEGLVTQAKGKGVPVDDAKKAATFAQTLSALRKEVAAKEDVTRDEISKRIYATDSLSDEQAEQLDTHWRLQLKQVRDGWTTFVQGLGGDVKALKDEAASVTKQFEKLSKSQKNAKAADVKHTLDQVAAQKTAELDGTLPQRIEAVIAALARLGKPVAKLQEALQKASKDNTALATLLELASRQLAEAERAQKVGRAQARRKQYLDVEWPLNSLPASKEYKKELEKESLDTLALVDTRDPDLLVAAKAKQARLAKLLQDIEAQPELHNANKKRLGTLGSRIAKMLDAMPETNRSLQTLLTEEFVQAKHTDPLAMKARIDAFEKEKVEAAEVVLERRKQEIQAITNAELKVNKLFTEMRSATSTTVTNRAESFEAYFNARMNDIATLRKSESGFQKAMAMIQPLMSKLEQILNADNKQAQLRDFDAEERQNQRLVTDMAAQFERELAAFKATALVQAKAAAKADDEGDEGQAASLGDVAKAAGKIVSPYLKLLKTLPHETRGAQPAPDLQRMKDDFRRARAMLAEAHQTAQRLIDSPASTNVQGPSKDGLRRVQTLWRERTQAYASAVRAVATAMRDAGTAETDPTTKQKTEVAAKMVDALAGTFRAEAFAAPITGLMQPLPGDKAGKEKVQREHLAHREEGLRLMRQFRAEVTENPLRKMLTDPAQNPFEAATLLVAAAGLRTALKEIDIQLLSTV